MTDRGTLHDELTNDPLGRGYESMTDAEVVNSLTTKDRTVHADLNSNRASRWLLASGDRYEQLEQAATDSALSPQVRGMAKLALAQVKNRSLVLRPDDPADQGLIDTLFTAVFGTEERNNLMAMLARQVSRAREIGIPNVDEQDVGHVRAW